ncbi:MAG TPA: hypothetical protein PKU91_05425, partial [Phycisphaerales bacterium]|nr:hypothetical protein [Phycisphaerales bacterium]
MAVLSIRSAAVAAVLAAGSLASATVYTDLASFLANTQPGYYFNNFSSVGAGPSGPLAFGPVNGYSYVVDTIGPGNTAPTSGLYNNPGVISTDNATDLIRVTFTGAPVTAVGGNFWGTDINFGAIPTTVTIALSNGDVETFVTNSSTAFRGFT